MMRTDRRAMMTVVIFPLNSAVVRVLVLALSEAASVLGFCFYGI
jgi:hypothetical protein